ncbi:MAG: hypothetical protein Q3989_10715 [Eubacteriales bacterium]|nr:hypothetical protein [Eubacteriales bacterium]
MAKSKKAINVAVVSKSKKQVREDLVAQLRAMGADVLAFKDLIDRYMFYRDMEIKLQKDIANRGLEFETISATGKIYMKENPSVQNAVLYNKQCLAILKQLGLNTKTIEPNTEDDEL